MEVIYIKITSIFKNAWRLLTDTSVYNQHQQDTYHYESASGYFSSYRPSTSQFSGDNRTSMIASIFNRIAIDVSSIDFKHVKIDNNERYTETVKSTLNRCLTMEANIDQTGKDFMLDVMISLLDEGCVAIIPTVTDVDPFKNEEYNIEAMRVAKIVQWFPKKVQIEIYNDITGVLELYTVPKNKVAILQNPFYSVMNEPNSTLKRLISKLNVLDVIDNQAVSGKLNMIIQTPYGMKMRNDADAVTNRLNEVNRQLKESPYGIAYIDASEKITQLQRPYDNNLLSQVEYLTKLLWTQLGISEDVLNCNASEETMLNYNNRIVEPFLTLIKDEFTRKLLSRKQQDDMERIMFYSNPFKLVPVGKIADIADKLNRNEILTSNEIRQIIGFMPSKQEGADELRNKNISMSKEEIAAKQNKEVTTDVDEE